MSPGLKILKKIESMALPPWLQRLVGATTVVVHDVLRCDLLKQASAMAYVTLLSLVPSLVAIFCVLSLFSPMLGKDNMMEAVREFVLSNLASASGQQVVAYLDQMIGGLDLKKIGWQSFASVLVTLVLLLRQIEEALNRIWLVHKARNIFTRFMYFWTFLTLGTVVMATVIGVSSGFKIDSFFVIGAEVQRASAERFGFVSTWLGSFIFFFLLYKIVPNCWVHTRPAILGACVSSTVLFVAGIFYGLFVRDSKNYQTLYGAIAQLPIFLLWLYICWTIILLGALIAWRVQEGFPHNQQEDTLDATASPIDELRNVQVKALLPQLVLLAVYRNFHEATGKGIGTQALAHALKLPQSWVGEALNALEQMGLVIVTKSQARSLTVEPLDAYFPAIPADRLSVTRLISELGKPVSEWMAHWQTDLPMGLANALQQLQLSGEHAFGEGATRTVADLWS